jgi:putative phosphoesterase
MRAMRIGLISDTHGLLRPQALQFLRGCDHIVHGGDIGAAAVLTALEAIAPVAAVRGNNDGVQWAAGLPETQTLLLGGVAIFVLHDFKELEQRPYPAQTQVVVCGHSHRPLVRQQAGGVLVVNPGSAGPRRFKLPVTAAELTIGPDRSVFARIVDLLTIGDVR